MKLWQKIFAVLVTVCLLTIQLPVSAGEGGEPEVTADAAIIIESTTGRVVWEKNADDRLYPASMTKMMTGILALEKMDMDAVVTYSQNAANTESSPLGALPGESLVAKDMLAGLLLESDNGAAVALAEAMSGNVESFAAEMNSKARQLGMSDTHFANPNGLTDKQHYSTARDMAKLARYAMKNKDFRKIVGTKNREIFWRSPVGKKYQAENTNKLLDKYEGITGIKTGWTRAAEGCLAVSAKRNGVELIVILMKADTPEDRFTDGAKLLDYGFDHVKMVKGPAKEKVRHKVWVKGGTQATAYLYPAHDIELPLINGDDKNKYTLAYDVPKVVAAPLQAGTEVGQIVLSYDGRVVEEVPMIADKVPGGFSIGSWLVGVFEGVLKLI